MSHFVVREAIHFVSCYRICLSGWKFERQKFEHVTEKIFACGTLDVTTASTNYQKMIEYYPFANFI
jgi:hypothetical protein